MDGLTKTMLKNVGLNPADYTEHQLDLMVEPWVAPENYHHDGEVTPAEAEVIWTRKLKANGLSEETIKTLKNLFL